MEAFSPLSARARRILAALVREHIETGEPVGSHAIVRSGGLDISPATVRNELARLEERGYLLQPHTSAGRIPSDLGYRAYVDMLLQSRPSTRRRAPALEADLRERAGGAALLDDVLSHVCHVVSRASRYVGFAIAPHHARATFQHIDFVPLAGTAVLAVVVLRGGEVSRKVVDLGRRVPPEEMKEVASYLNESLAGLALEELRGRLAELRAVGSARHETSGSTELELARVTFEDPMYDQPIYIEGAASLLERLAAGGMSLGTMRALLQMVEEKHRLVQLLSTCLADPGLSVVIGREHGADDLREVAIVASTYSDGDRVGGVGIIGPLRMHYARAIPLVEGVAQAVSRVLSDSGWGDHQARC